MLKFKKSKSLQEASSDSVRIQSSGQKKLQFSCENLAFSEKENTDRQRTTEDSNIGSNDDAGSDCEVELNVRPPNVFYTKVTDDPSGVPSKIQLEDAQGVRGEMSRKSHSEMTQNLLGDDSQSKSKNTSESSGKQLHKKATDDGKSTVKCSGENIKDDPRLTPSLDSCTDTTPITSSVECETERTPSVLRSCWSQRKELKGQLFSWKGGRCCQQLLQGALCYVFWFIACMVCAVLIVRLENKDGPACILAAIIWCNAVTLILERGYFTYWLDQKALQESAIEGDVSGPSCNYFCLCCEVEEALLEQRQSRYTRTNRETNTAFVCEVSDVSSINPSDCPQMKTVEQSGDDSPSSDHCPARSRVVKAVVHCSEMEVEEDAFIHQCDCPGACACPIQYKEKAAGSSSRRPKKSEKALLIGKPDVRSGASDELSQEQIWKWKHASPTLSSPEDVFVCDYHDKGVACACADFVKKSPLHSTNTEDLPAYGKIDPKWKTEKQTPLFSSNSDDVFNFPGASARPKQHRKKYTNVASSKHPNKNEKRLIIGETDDSDETSD